MLNRFLHSVDLINEAENLIMLISAGARPYVCLADGLYSIYDKFYHLVRRRNFRDVVKSPHLFYYIFVSM